MKNSRTHLKKFFYLLVAIILTLGLSVSFQSLLANWTSPGAIPPEGNTFAPIYATSSVNQTIDKSGGTGGGLGIVGNFTANQATFGGNVAFNSWISYDGGNNGIYIMPGGKVGIGTTTPNQNLTIFNNLADSAIEFSSASGPKNKWTIGQDYSDGQKFKIASSTTLGNIDRVVINGNGYVGIGTNTPHNLLEVYDSTAGLPAATIRVTDTNNNPEIQLQYGPINANDHWGIFDDQSNNDSFNIWSYNGGTPGNRLTILQNGNVGINQVAPSEKLDVIGNVKATSFLYSSDIRLKEVLKPIENALEKIKELNGFEFKWKADGRLDIGLIAQDVEKVVPQVVATDKNTGLKSVEYGNLNALLIEAVKEQNKKIELLESRLKKLEKNVIEN
jgi:hypothetical protein